MKIEQFAPEEQITRKNVNRRVQAMAEGLAQARAITCRLPVAEGYSVKAGDVVDVGGAPFSEKAAVGSRTEGSIVYLNEDGKPVEFYVAKHDYESGLNGAGRTLVVRKDLYNMRQWHNANVNAYATSDIDSWLNGSYKGLLDLDVQSAIGTTKFPYTPGNGNWAVGTLARAIFLLSLAELGKSRTYSNTEGSKLPIADTLIVASFEGHPTDQWTRSMSTDNTSNAHILLGRGIADGKGCSSFCGSRPVFTLPADFEVLVPSDAIVKNIEPQANVETVTNGSAVSITASCDLNASYALTAEGASSGVNHDVHLISKETGKKVSEAVYINNDNLAVSSLSLSRLDDSRFVVGYLESGCLRAKVGTVSGTNISLGTLRTAINSNLSQGILIALSDTKVLAIANRNGIDARVCTISGTEIDDDTGANHATVPGVTAVSKLSATLLPDDKSGNKRVCVCFKDESDEGGKAVIATIDSADQVTWGDAVTWMDTFRISDFLSCCFDGTHVIVACNNVQTLRALNISPALSVAGKPYSVDPVTSDNAIIAVDGKPILLYYDGRTTTPNRGGRARVIHNDAGKLSAGPAFVLNPDAQIKYVSAAALSRGRFLAAYADGGDSNRGTCTILTVEGDRIAGSFQNKSSQAIALQDGGPGDLIDIIYSGTAELPGTAQGTKIESPGVHGYAPVDGLLDVAPWYLPGVKIATGSYTGNGAYGSGNPNTLTFPFEPKMLMVLPDPTSATPSYSGFWCFGNPGITGQINSNYSSGSTVSVSGNTISWFSIGNAQIQLNVDNQKYYYIALG